MGREYAHRIDECISDYVKDASDEVKRLFVLNQVRGAISRDFQKEISFSLKDYRFVSKYLTNADNRNLLQSFVPYKYAVFLRILPLYYLYSRLYAYYKWVKRGMRNLEIV